MHESKGLGPTSTLKINSKVSVMNTKYKFKKTSSLKQSAVAVTAAADEDVDRWQTKESRSSLDLTGAGWRASMTGRHRCTET